MRLQYIIAIFLLYMAVGIFIERHTQPNDPLDLSLVLLWPFAFIFVVEFLVINLLYSIKDKVVEWFRKVMEKLHD